MTSKTLLIVFLLLGTVLVLLSPTWGQVEQRDIGPMGTLLVQPAAQGPMMRDFTIYVGTTGFNSTYETGMTLTVNEGDRVTIRFVYNDTDLRYNNPHEVFIEGYGLYSGTIDRANPERTVAFTANIPGPTTFSCTVTDCVGHASLLNGVVDVQPYTGPKITTSLSLSAQASRGNVSIFVRAVDALSSPVAGILVHFYRDSTWGFAEVGAGATNPSGEASLVYELPSTDEITLKAEFLGSGLYSSSSSQPLTIEFPGPSSSEDGFPYVWGQNTLVDIRIVGVPSLSGLLWISVAFLIVGSVWVTYLYVGRQLLGIWEESGEQVLGYEEQSIRIAQRKISFPSAIMTGVFMAALGFADLLTLTFLVSSMSLLLFPILAFTEAILVARLISR